jgi:type IV pilus biogenesis protein CpaD/CtpE
MRFSPVLPLLFALTAGLSACAHNTDLIATLNDQDFGDVNAANIAAMVANPADLVRGHGSSPAGGPMVVMPIDRIETDRPKSITGSAGGAGGASGGGAGSGSGG